MPFLEMAPEFNPGVLFEKYLRLRPSANEPSSSLFVCANVPTKKNSHKVADPNFNLFVDGRPIGKNHVTIMCKRLVVLLSVLTF